MSTETVFTPLDVQALVLVPNLVPPNPPCREGQPMNHYLAYLKPVNDKENLSPLAFTAPDNDAAVYKAKHVYGFHSLKSVLLEDEYGSTVSVWKSRK